MSKQITADELAEITARLLKNDDGFLAHPEQFMTDVANLVCRYCGGVTTGDATEQDGELMVGIADCENYFEGGGIWKGYDGDGEL